MSWHLCIRRPFCSSLAALAPFPHAQIFGDNFPNTAIFHVQLTCNHSNSLPTISMHNLLYRLDVHLSAARWRPPTPGVIFHLLAPFFEPLVPLKGTSSWHCVISIHLLKHFKCLWQIVFIWKQNRKERSCIQTHVKKCKSCRKLRLQLQTPKTSC